MQRPFGPWPAAARIEEAIHQPVPLLYRVKNTRDKRYKAMEVMATSRSQAQQLAHFKHPKSTGTWGYNWWAELVDPKQSHFPGNNYTENYWEQRRLEKYFAKKLKLRFDDITYGSIQPVSSWGWRSNQYNRNPPELQRCAQCRREMHVTQLMMYIPEHESWFANGRDAICWDYKTCEDIVETRKLIEDYREAVRT